MLVSEGQAVTVIGPEAFRACDKLRTSEIPDGVRFIGFEGYRAATSW